MEVKDLTVSKNTRMVIGTEVTFDAAHRLTFHKGKCKNLHGHTWKVKVKVSGPGFLDMVVDFGEIKNIVKELDHKVLVYKEDTWLRRCLDEGEFAVVILEHETTAENLAKYIKGRILECMQQDFYVKVRVYETETNYAEY
jgi:6-pyruvoyltetrahydropterin/6-carboxytetrahydropterin synthase